MAVVTESPTRRRPARAAVAPEAAAPFERTGRRVRQEVADGAAVVAFSLGTSVLLAVLIGLALHLAG